MEHESILEWGMISLVIAALAGVAIFFGSELVSSLMRRRRDRKAPPALGAVSPERHLHVQAPAAH